MALMTLLAAWLVKSGVDRKKQNAHLREVCTEQVAGVVKDYNATGKYYVDSEGDTHDSRSDFPVFEYTACGRVHTWQSERYDTHGKRRYEIGQTVTVFHAPGEPEVFYILEEIKGSDDNARLCVISGAVLLALCVVAIAKLVVMFENNRLR